MAIGASGWGRAGGARWMGWAAGRGRAWDLGIGPQLAASLTLHLPEPPLPPPQWRVGAGRSKPPNRDREIEALRASGRGFFPVLPRTPALSLSSASPRAPCSSSHATSLPVCPSRSFFIGLFLCSLCLCISPPHYSFQSVSSVPI